MSFQTRGDEELFLAVYRLLRAVYSSTGGEWPGDEATAEADKNEEQQLCALVTHHHGWLYRDEG